MKEDKPKSYKCTVCDEYYYYKRRTEKVKYELCKFHFNIWMKFIFK